jgi:hypothetical protein
MFSRGYESVTTLADNASPHHLSVMVTVAGNIYERNENPQSQSDAVRRLIAEQ